MEVALFKVDKNMCAECSLVLRRFIGGMDGVNIHRCAERGNSRKFDETKVDEKNPLKIAAGQH